MIGNYQVSQMDYYYDDITETNRDKKMLENQEIEIKLHFKGKEGLITIKISELHKVKFDEETKKYFIFYGDDDLYLWLWNYLLKKKIEVKVSFMVNINIHDLDYKLIPKLYLQSNLLDEKIVCSTEYNEFIIKSIEELNWAFSKGFCYSKLK